MPDNGKDAAREARRQIADHKGAWRNRLLCDRHLSNAAKVVGCGIAEHINRASKEAYAGVRRLAIILHISRGLVNDAIHELADAGWIDVVEWGTGTKSSTFRLIIDIEKPDLFPFNKYALDDFAEAERVRPAELPSVHPAERKKGHQRSPRRTLEGSLASGKSVRSVRKKRGSVRPAERNPVLTPDNPSKSAPSARSSADADRESATTTSGKTTDDEIPNQRTPEGALIDTVAAKQPPSCRASEDIGIATRADADPAFAEVYRRGREVLGADADAVTAKLLSVYGGDVEEALNTLAAAEVEESGPSRRQYIEKDIEAAARAPPMR